MSRKDVAEEVAAWKFFIQEAEKEGKEGKQGDTARRYLDKVTLSAEQAAELMEIEVGSLQWMANQG
jgi:hypothetical protein